MGLKRSSTLTTKKPLKRGKFINRKGPRATLWDYFVEQERRKARDEQGLIACEDYKIGLPRCNGRVPTPDLHHTEGREGLLLLDRTKMVWLIRGCHDKAHNRNSSSPSSETSYDAERQVGEAPSSPEIPPVQGRFATLGARPTGRTVFSSVSRSNAEFVERQKKGGV